MDEIKAKRSLVVRRLGIAIAVIACGLALRLTGYEIGLPYPLVKYGGSTLWGMMVFWLVGVLMPGMRLGWLTAFSIILAALVEFSRLYHTPWLDAFRLELIGALLLGRIFSWLNIVAYIAGILIAVWIERSILFRKDPAAG